MISLEVDVDNYTKAVAQFFRFDVDVLWNDAVKAVIIQVRQIFELRFEEEIEIGATRRSGNSAGVASSSTHSKASGRSGNPAGAASSSMHNKVSGKCDAEDAMNSNSSSPRSDSEDVEDMFGNLVTLGEKIASPTCPGMTMNADEKMQTLFVINHIMRSDRYSRKLKSQLMSKLGDMSPTLDFSLFIK